MTFAASIANDAATTGLSHEDLYYWDPEQRRYVWTETHLRLFLENAAAPIETIQPRKGPGIVCYVTSWEALL